MAGMRVTFTFTIDSEYAEEIEKIMGTPGYPDNRSALLRRIVREWLDSNASMAKDVGDERRVR